MIQLLERLEPEVKVSWTTYSIPSQVDWLHSGKRILENPEQVYPSSGPASIIPTAVFNINTYDWDSVGW